ncbi:hypothetical protein GGP41_008425 [Bipolaris sorokiniana]|uniref:Uncharacterized protein n=1 Tax=Cochliobolus sativus TaxID=45130 RepID=A0A8H6DTN4_COCSA|nr:hypothetical protein GGP41_008425 [Bipolaris sorokiniana]
MGEVGVSQSEAWEGRLFFSLSLSLSLSLHVWTLNVMILGIGRRAQRGTISAEWSNGGTASGRVSVRGRAVVG